MAETKRCPNCGGLNPVSADWCGQCHERFTPKPAPEPLVTAAPPAQAAPVDEPAVDVTALLAGIGGKKAVEAETPAAPKPAAPPPPAESVGTKHGAFTVREHGVVWTCSRCEAENPLDRQICAVCGTTFAEVVRPPEERAERDPGMAAMVSLFFPGAGHGYLGMWGQAVARAVLSLWVLFVVLISILQRGQSGSALIGVVFGLAATALWAASAHDAYREARHETNQVLLKGKVFLYLVLGLLVLLLILLTSSGLRARG